jgi:hypothetical protein
MDGNSSITNPHPLELHLYEACVSYQGFVFLLTVKFVLTHRENSLELLNHASAPTIGDKGVAAPYKARYTMLCKVMEHSKHGQTPHSIPDLIRTLESCSIQMAFFRHGSWYHELILSTWLLGTARDPFIGMAPCYSLARLSMKCALQEHDTKYGISFSCLVSLPPRHHHQTIHVPYVVNQLYLGSQHISPVVVPRMMPVSKTATSFILLRT